VSAGKHKLHFAVESNQGYLHYYYVNYPEGCPVNVQMVGYIKKHVHK